MFHFINQEDGFMCFQIIHIIHYMTNNKKLNINKNK